MKGEAAGRAIARRKAMFTGSVRMAAAPQGQLECLICPLSSFRPLEGGGSSQHSSARTKDPAEWSRPA